MASECTSSVIILDASNAESDTKSSGKCMNARTVFPGPMYADALTSLFDFTSHSSTSFSRTYVCRCTHITHDFTSQSSTL